MIDKEIISFISPRGDYYEIRRQEVEGDRDTYAVYQDGKCRGFGASDPDYAKIQIMLLEHGVGPLLERPISVAQLVDAESRRMTKALIENLDTCRTEVELAGALLENWHNGHAAIAIKAVLNRLNVMIGDRV